MDLRRPTGAVRLLLAAGLLTAALAGQSAAQSTPAPTQLLEQALDLAYNLDHDPAIVLLRRAVALAPGDPAAHRSLASVLWLNILFRRGAVTVDHYLGAFTRSSIDLPRPPADVEAEFKTHVQRAIALAEARVEVNGADVQARYDVGAALGLEASYVATVEGRMLAGFRAARRSFDEHERVLALDPSRNDAGLIVGTYRYLVSTFSLPMRLMAYVAGFGGDGQRGLQLIEGAARDSRRVGGARADAQTEAMFALILMYNRERRYDDAMRVIQDLRRLYPRNRLLLLEAGATALRAGRASEAEALLTEGLGLFVKETRLRIPGEEALWRYKRGAARVALRRADASEDLQRAAAADAQAWVGGRARVELGRLALARGDRSTAAASARAAESLCGQGNDPECVDEARTLLRRARGR
jgi:tetratricopeptide (TPR) repeat protein